MKQCVKCGDYATQEGCNHPGICCLCSAAEWAAKSPQEQALWLKRKAAKSLKKASAKRNRPV